LLKLAGDFLTTKCAEKDTERHKVFMVEVFELKVQVPVICLILCMLIRKSFNQEDHGSGIFVMLIKKSPLRHR